MKSNVQIIDGEKAVSLTSEEGWTYFTNLPKTTQEEQYARVAAVFAAYNLIANTIGNMPFVLYQGETEYDTSAKWQNACGFLPRPEELLRLDTLSLIATNTAYNLRTADVLGRKTKGLYNAVAYAFAPITDPVTGQLKEIQRRVGLGEPEHYTPDDKRLIRLWRMDHTTEVLPSKNTMAQAVMSNAGQVYYADLWISHFYQRGGIAPTVLAMKGMVMKEKKDDEEKSWTDWLKGLGKYTNRIARIFNAEAMDVKQLGSSVTDLKNNEVYRQALEGIAVGMQMPLSLLLANSANYATAQQEYATWINNFVTPLCKWIASEYNVQVWQPLGLRMEFKPETLDPEQEDETQRAAAASQFMDFMGKCETYEVFIGACETFGYELSDTLISAADTFFKEKQKKADELAKQMQNKRPVPNQAEPKQPPEPKQPAPPAKWLTTPDHLRELKVLEDVALRRLKRGESMDFEYQPHYGGLPEAVMQHIQARLHFATTNDDIKKACSVEDQPAPAREDVSELAKALNRYADALTRAPASS